jgi:Leucine-rich repeat (LRR) protein/uncharacterized membrane protein
MNTINRVVFNVIFCIQVLLVFLVFFEERIELPPWLQVVGRLHPLVLHLPIGFLIFLAIVAILQKQIAGDSARHILHLGLLVTSLSASVAALFGFFLSLQDDYGRDALMLHKLSGVVVSWFCYVLLLWHHNQRKKKLLYGFGALTLVTLVVAGHTGAVLTHGQNFVLAPMSSPPALTVDNASVYDFAVRQIFDRKCFSCHNETRAKGGLVMTSMDKFKEGGKHGKAWVEGKPEESRMIKAFYLPLSHDEHMPPDGKPQLTAVEISTIEAWIKSGADFEKKLNQFADGDSIKLIVASYIASKAEAEAPIVEKQYNFDAVSSDVVAELNTPFRSVFPLYQNSPAIQADFFLKDNFQIKSLEELKSVANQLVVLNLSKMPVTDKDLKIISSFRNLEILNLNFTSIQGSGLTDLAQLENLQSLSLAGTSVKATDVETILKLPKLTEIYVWNSQVSDADRDALAKQYPEVEIIGNLFSDSKVLKLGKPRLENEGVIRKGELISLKHSMPGVSIRISKDSSYPDSVNSEVYKEPFAINEAMVLKARACKDGWYCSDILDVTCFVEGIAPAHVELLSPADKQYPGKGAPGLTDLQKGFADIFKEPSWLGYRNGPFSAVFDFESKMSLREIVISYGKNIGGFIFPPDEVEIWAGDDKKNLKLLKKVRSKLPTGYTPNGVEALPIDLDVNTSYQYYRVVAKPVAKLPEWHDKKGEKGWFFVDEVFFY